MDWIWDIPVVVGLDEEPGGFVNLVKSVDGIWVSFNDDSLVILDTTDSVIDGGGEVGFIEHLNSLIEVFGLFENDSQVEIGWDIILDEEVDADISESGNSILSSIDGDGVFSILNSGEDQGTSNNHLGSGNILVTSHEIDGSSHS